MKKILFILTAFLSLMIFPMTSEASSGSIKITSSSSQVIVGNTVTVKVTLSSGIALGSWEFDINYDNSFLKLTESNADNGGTYFVNAGDGKSKSKTYTLKFRALKSGATNITVGSNDVYGYDKSSMSISKTNKRLTLMTQKELEASYSKENNLKDLTVEGYTLDKPFNKDTLEYTVNVPTGTTKVNIKASKNDSTATVTGAGEIEVTEGTNTVDILVIAQNGAEKTYKLTINVEDQNPINVTYNNTNYTVIKNATLLTAPETFKETTLTIDDCEIPGFINENANLTLVGLKDPSDNISLFIYKDGTYTLFNEIGLNNYFLIPVPFKEELNLPKTMIKINNEDIEAYKLNDESNLVIINALNLENGKESLYLYDIKDNTSIPYYSSLTISSDDTLTNYTYIIIAFAGALFLMLIVIFILLHSLKKKQKKIDKFIKKQEAKIEATRKLNDVVEEVKKITEEEKHVIKQDTTEIDNKPETKNKKKKKIKVEEVKLEEPKQEKSKETQIDDSEEVYDIFEDDRKKKNKK